MSQLEKAQIRSVSFKLVDFAELLLNLQDIHGFDTCIDRLKGGVIEPTFAELDLGRMLYCGDVDFRFVEPQQKKGLDYDIEITLPDGMLVCADAKCKVEATDFSAETVKRSLEKARAQFPKDRPSIVFMKGQAHALPRRKNFCLQNPLAPKNLLAIYSLIAVALLADDTHYPVSHENRHKPGNHRPAPFCRRRRRKKRLGPSLAGLVAFACEGSRRRHFKRGASVDHQAGVRDGSRARGCESAMSEGQQIDLDQYGRLTGRLCRLLEMIGIRRLARPIDPLSDLAKAFEDTAKAIDDDDEDSDEPLPPEKGSDKSEPGEA